MAPGYFLQLMRLEDFAAGGPVYVATDEPAREWFAPLDAAYNLSFAAQLAQPPLLDALSTFPQPLWPCAACAARGAGLRGCVGAGSSAVHMHMQHTRVHLDIHMPHAKCHMPHGTCMHMHMPHATCHMPHATCTCTSTSNMHVQHAHPQPRPHPQPQPHAQPHPHPHPHPARPSPAVRGRRDVLAVLEQLVCIFAPGGFVGSLPSTLSGHIVNARQVARLAAHAEPPSQAPEPMFDDGDGGASGAAAEEAVRPLFTKLHELCCDPRTRSDLVRGGWRDPTGVLLPGQLPCRKPEPWC
eukprot:512672-Prymnesium_polylepis.1